MITPEWWIGYEPNETLGRSSDVLTATIFIKETELWCQLIEKMTQFCQNLNLQVIIAQLLRKENGQ